jgi:hypothetical protein
MAAEKPIVDEDIATLITEALISAEAAGVGLESMIAREGAKPGLVEASRRLSIVKEMLRDLDKFTRAPGANDNG